MNPMRMHALPMSLVSVVALCSCELPGEVAEKLPSEGEGEGEGPDVRVLEDTLFDVLECQEIARPSTLDRIRDVLEDPTTEEVQALLLNPTDLASLVAQGGTQVEVAVIVLQNLYRLANDGAIADVVQNGWDGVQCGEPVTISCTSGTETTTVSCDADAAVQEIAVAFDDCVVDGTLRQGGLALAREAADESRGVLSFDAFTIDEVETFEGALSLSIATGEPRLEADADSELGFELISHGGLDSDVSCGEETRVSVAHLAVTDGDALLELEALKVGKDDEWRIATIGEHLRFSDLAAFDDCRCPDVGAGLEIDVPRPLGQDGETARARIFWAPSEDAGLCRDARVTLEDWPTECGALSASKPDCAEASTERALSALFRALCAH